MYISIYWCISVYQTLQCFVNHFCENNVTNPCTVSGNILELVLRLITQSFSGTDIDHDIFEQHYIVAS